MCSFHSLSFFPFVVRVSLRMKLDLVRAKMDLVVSLDHELNLEGVTAPARSFQVSHFYCSFSFSLLDVVT